MVPHDPYSHSYFSTSLPILSSPTPLLSQVMLAVTGQIAHERAIQRRYVDLQKVYSSKSQKRVGDTTPAATKLDQNLRATNQLNDVAARLDDANVILEDCRELLMDKNAIIHSWRNMVSNLKNLLLPL